MAIVINGSGTVTGISVGGLPDGIVDAGTVAADVATQAELDTVQGLSMPLDGGNFAGHVRFNDNIECRIGTGNDLKIYHDASDSIIADTGTGALEIRSNELKIKNAVGDENAVYFAEDGAVTLYHNNVSKLLTTSDGIQINGNIEIGTHPFAITGEGGSDRLTIQENTGAVWIDGNCSAASFTDRTPYPETLQLAYDVINSHQKLPENEYKADDQSKQLDHSNLHEYVSVTTPADLWTENDNLPEGVSVGDIKKEEEKSRNMSGVISCLVEVIRDLSAKNEELTTRITALENA
jgi:hypothetical protein